MEAAAAKMAKEVEEKAKAEAAAAKMAKEKEEKAKAEAEKRAKASKKANIDMALETKWTRQIFEVGWEGRPSGDSFNRCFETMWCN